LKKIFFVPLLTFLFAGAFAQTVPDSMLVKIDSVRDASVIEKSTLLYIDSVDHVTVENLPFSKFVPLQSFSRRSRVPQQLITKNAYLEFSLQNKTGSAAAFYFFPGMPYKNIILYEKGPEGKLKKSAIQKGRTGFAYVTLNPYQAATFVLQLRFSKTEFNKINAVLIKPDYLETYILQLTNIFRDSRIASYILCGVLLMMILFTLVNYFLNNKSNKTEFLYFFLYSLCMFFLIFFSAYLNRRPGWFTAFFRGYFDVVLLMVGTIFYLFFIRKFLDTKNKHATLEKLFKIEIRVLIVFLLLFTYLHFATGNILLGKILENLMKILAMALGTVFIILGLRNNDKLMKYLAIGSAAQIFFSIVSLLLIFFPLRGSELLKSALFYFEVSIIMAVFFFLLGLTYKNRRELIEKTKEQEAMKLEVEKKGFETQLAVIKAQQEERNRISADMHDDLGAGMTTIRLFSELAKTKMGDKTIPEIDKISASANELLNKMNAIIWSMSSSNDSLGNMIAYIRSYALDYFENTGIECKITIPESLPELEVSGEIRRNIFLVVKEALNNIVKHSGATLVKIVMQKEPEGLSLLIHDNGNGIDLEKIRQFGNGLKNMKKRMEDVDIEFSIANDHGTVVRLYRKTR